MKTKPELADFLRNGDRDDIIVPHAQMVEYFEKPLVLASHLDGWLKSNGLDFDASLMLGTLTWVSSQEVIIEPNELSPHTIAQTI